jgi:hypothetical protein
MNTITRRIAAGFTIAAAPVLIFLGAASANAESSVTNFGPTHHEPFPHQDHVPAPGTSVHHHHQYNRAR